jgi:nucleotide-binding universal stress UspA family protein
MYDRILFPTDGSEPAESPLKYALQIAAEHEATIHVLNVVDTSQDSLIGSVAEKTVRSAPVPVITVGRRE